MHNFKPLLISAYFILFAQLLSAKVFPKEGSVLNYRLIGFSFDNKDGKYQIEIANGYFNNIDSFNKNVLTTISSRKNKVIAEVPSFGKQYTWRVNSTDHSSKNQNTLYHFSTGFVPVLDTSMFRFRILQQAKKYKDAVVMVDATGVLYDMNGQPLWYLPGIKYETNTAIQPRDIKLSPFGTITYILDSNIYEINYNGDTLWANTNRGTKGKFPNNRDQFYFHHEFTRLANGHYMTLGCESVLCKFPTGSDTNFIIVPFESVADNDKKNYKQKASGDLVEFDEKGNIVWIWKSSKYVVSSDLKYFSKSLNGFIDLHDNAFYLDEKEKCVYISCKYVDRIVKVKYPEGNVVGFYGSSYNKQGVEENKLFHCQHAIKRADDGYLYLFDNGCDNKTEPKLILMQEPANKKDSLKIIWEYKCDIDEMENFLKKGENPGGGNVTELADGSLFASMGLRSGIMMIVNLNKQILWSAIREHWNRTENKWEMIFSYRSSIIANRKDLEQLIWNSEKE